MVPRMVVALLATLALFAPNAYAAPDGAFITANNAYYRIIGGAALRVGSCAPLDGCPGAVADNPSAYPTVPRNGTFIRVPDGPRAGLIARVAGGRAFWIRNCQEVEGGCPGWIALDSGGYDAYENAHPTVADGAFVRRPDGLIARAAGTVLIGLGACPPGGCTDAVNVDTASFSEYERAHLTMTDGTYVRRPDGAIARAVGGALLGIGSCALLNGCPGWVQLDDAGFNNYGGGHAVIAPGTFVRVMTKDGPLIARAAGGRLLFLTDCGVLGGCPGAVDVDQTAASNYQNAHPLVADGTVLRGQPSGHVYRIAGGVRTTTGDATGAVDVNDAVLAQFLDGDPLPGPADRDGDGVTPPLDCDDSRADVRPGATDVPGDGIDQDCSGADAAFPKLDLLVGAFFDTRGSRTTLTSFYVRSVPAGTRLTLRCGGRGCPFKSRSVTVNKATARYSLLSRMKKAKLRTGAKLELQITHAGMIGKVIRWTIRTGKAPKRSNLCLPPGAKKATSCAK